MTPTARSLAECRRRERLAERNYKHGMSNTPTWRSWKSMLDRCLSPKHTYYETYGGRGIRVCDRWRAFEAFLSDMGQRPDGLTLDRIDSDGDYEPGNCRWTTKTQQGRNKRSTKLTIEIARDIRRRRDAGESLLDIARLYRVTISTVSAIHLGKRWKEGA